MYSIPQAAKILKLSRGRVWRLVKDNRIESIKIDGGKRTEYRLTEEALKEFKKTHTGRPGQPRKNHKPSKN
jgi:excisionase family DNA binding protein